MADDHFEAVAIETEQPGRLLRRMRAHWELVIELPTK